MSRPLDDEAIQQLRSAPFTYAEVGRTLTDADPPPGFRGIERQRVIGAGAAAFDRSVQRLMTWQMHRRAGVGVRASSATIDSDTVAVLRLGPVAAPVRVVTVVEDADRRGFAYGTLPGHPESGEEAFVISRDAFDQVVLTIRAFSHSMTLLARAGGPVTRWVQQLATERYLRALVDVSG